ncbi:MAG: Aminoalkylphosphonate N-acetyltransferase [Pseudomonadota bacterium]|jgi:GNAT superfamily N-acetyltransferase
MIRIAQTDEQILACFSAMQQLRPHLQEAEFLPFVRLMMDEGYRLACFEQDGQVLGVAGFKISHNFYLTKRCYVEDLVTIESARGQGVGEKLFDWLSEHAKAQQCRAIHLDSGVQRHGAHKFYLNRDMKIVCHHFVKELA